MRIEDIYPLRDGVFPKSSAIVRRFDGLPQERQTVFDFSDADRILQNKQQSRERALHKYYRRFTGSRYAPIIRKAVARLEEEVCVTYPGVDGMDSLAMEVPADIVVMYAPTPQHSEVISVHLCQPFGWTAEWAIGKSFASIHEDVKRTDGNLVMKNPGAIAYGMAHAKGEMERIGAISFRSNNNLDTHPDYGGRNKMNNWYWHMYQQVYLRFERQVIIPLPEYDSFIFTVRPYYVDVTKPGIIEPTVEALKSYDPEVYPREFLNKENEKLLTFLLQHV